MIPALAKAEQLSERAASMPPSVEQGGGCYGWWSGSRHPTRLGPKQGRPCALGVPDDRLARQVETQRGRIADALAAWSTKGALRSCDGKSYSATSMMPGWRLRSMGG